MSILKPKSAEKSRTLSVRVPLDLHAQVEALRDDAEAAGLIFDVADIVGKALAAAVKAGRAELSAICTQNADSASGSLGQTFAPGVCDAARRDAGGASDRRESAVSASAAA